MSINRVKGIENRLGTEDQVQGQTVAFFVFGQCTILCNPGSPIHQLLSAFFENLDTLYTEWMAYTRYRIEHRETDDSDATAAMTAVTAVIDELLAIEFPQEVVNDLARISLAVRNNAVIDGRVAAIAAAQYFSQN